MNASRNAVKTRFTATHFTLTPHDYGQFALSLGKKSYLHILLIHPAENGHPVNTETFYTPQCLY